MSNARFYETDPNQRIVNALDDPDGKGGPFTKEQQQEKTERFINDRTAGRY
ncbi:hypothetical protein [Actinosynnema sp. ALI-1.44]|uniref:hypothetical protein n=1 Tax=Actinosynnema sp. ALI-1.44 TaxID=1933779 RepID=UPI00143CD448|nr:hypothetical protein [Actinosynnema sp. ALI-1.44]